jgi:4-hydroxy-tetrahydrodipicolinate synthase
MNERTPSAYVTSLTTFKENGDFDEGGMRLHLRRFAEAGIGVYVGGSGSGEGYSLSAGEVRHLLEIAREELQGRVPVRAMGTEPRTPQEMIEFGQVVQEIGLDAMQVYSLEVGHGGPPTDRELEDYLREVLEAISMPCVPSIHMSVGYLYPIELIARMVNRYSHVIGLNVTSDIHYLTRVIDAVGSKVEIHCGGPAHAMTILALGGTGYISSEANLVPALCVSLIEDYKAGRYPEAEAAYGRIMRLWPITSRYRGIRGTKAALGLLGLPGGFPRKPRRAVDEDGLKNIAQSLEDLEIRELLALPGVAGG